MSLCVAYNVDVLLPDHVPSCDCIPWSKNASASSAFSNIDNVDLADSACAMPANGNFPDPEAPIYAVYDGYCLCSPGDDSATTWFSWCSPPPLAPSQINLNVVNATAINVNFVTASVSENDSVHAQLKLKGDSGPTTNIIGYSTIYKDSTADRHLHYHNVLLHSLKERTHYEYRVKITSGTWSPWIPFQSLYSSGETNVAMYADFGFFSSQTKTESYDYPSPSRSHIGVILDDVANGLVDFALHSGDHAYEFEVGGGARGDAYMDLYQPFLQSTPWMAGWGNHEYLEGDYGNRLANITGGLIDAKRSVDGSVNRMFYSVDIGLLHTTIIDASPYHCNFENCMEVDSCGFPQEFIDLESGEADWLGYRAAILKWTEEDLARVDRTKTPWLFVTGHYPMYENGYVDPPEENKEADWGAKGDRWLKEEEEGEISPSADQFMADFEGLLEKYKVDVSEANRIEALRRKGTHIC